MTDMSSQMPLLPQQQTPGNMQHAQLPMANSMLQYMNTGVKFPLPPMGTNPLNKLEEIKLLPRLEDDEKSQIKKYFAEILLAN